MCLRLCGNCEGDCEEGDLGVQWAEAAVGDRWTVEAARTAPHNSGTRLPRERRVTQTEIQTLSIINSSTAEKWVMKIIFMEDAFYEL